MKYAPILVLLLALICRSNAQLNGEYTYDVAKIFQSSIAALIFPSKAARDNAKSVGCIYVGGLNIAFCLNWSHDPKTGRFTGSGPLEIAGFYPSSINRTINPQDYVVIKKSKTTLSGKTYTLNAVGNYNLQCADLSLTTKFDGTYITAQKTSYNFKNGLLSFSKNGNQPHDLDEGGDPTQLRGFIPLGGKNIKINIDSGYYESRVTLSMIGVDYPFSYDGIRGEGEYSEGSDIYNSLYLRLKLKTVGSKVKGTASIFFKESTEWAPGTGKPYEEYIYPNNDGYLFSYNVSGTSNNGFSTLFLTGTGRIKGLKATIYIKEDTQEILPNGKNSITLYGQTIRY
jgi:hypothetical protein